MKNNKHNPDGRSVKTAKSSGEHKAAQKTAKTAIPDDIRRNTYTQDRPAGLHVQVLGIKR